MKLGHVFTAAALLAASSAFAIADTTYTTTNSSSSNGNDYVGFAIALTNSSLTTTADSDDADDFSSISEGLLLSSITLTGRSSTHTSAGYNEFKIAVFTAGSSTTSIVGEYIGSSTNSGTLALNTSFTWNFDSLELGSSSTTYLFVFVSADTTDDDLSGDDWTAISTSLAAASMTSSGVSGLYGSITATTSQRAAYTYAPAMTIVTTVVSTEIPEPSAFGLLAGVGALALAVSRRRRSR